MKNEIQISNFSKWKYFLISAFLIAAIFIIKENLKLEKIIDLNFEEDFDKEEKLEIAQEENSDEREIDNSLEKCDRDVRLGKEGEFGVFPFISFPGSGNT